jgi:hypothetical protein
MDCKGGCADLGMYQKYLWFQFPTDPIFFLPTLAKMASVVTLIIEKNMKKIFKKNYF